jgi:adenine-specific DNA-methyltransferase
MAKKQTKSVEALRHTEDKRTNIPTAEHRSVLGVEEKDAKPVKYPRNTDLDPQLVWRGKDEQDWSDLVVHAPPLYIIRLVYRMAGRYAHGCPDYKRNPSLPSPF